MKKIVAIDFDGTIVGNNFPSIGKPQKNAFKVMKELQEDGWKLILWTCREDEGPRKKYLTDAVEFCKRHGVEFDAVNESFDEFRNSEKKRKVYCDYFIDDRNLGGFPGWDFVKKVLLEDQKPKFEFQEHFKLVD